MTTSTGTTVDFKTAVKEYDALEDQLTDEMHTWFCTYVSKLIGGAHVSSVVVETWDGPDDTAFHVHEIYGRGIGTVDPGLLDAANDEITDERWDDPALAFVARRSAQLADGIGKYVFTTRA